jgi:hypothetical protein
MLESVTDFSCQLFLRGGEGVACHPPLQGAKIHRQKTATASHSLERLAGKLWLGQSEAKHRVLLAFILGSVADSLSYDF